MMDNLRAVYIEEANELLAHLETALLALEENPGDKSFIEEVFRVMHTLKGNSSMFGLSSIADLVHELETIYEKVRAEAMPMGKSLLDCTFAALDHLKIIIHDPELSDPENRVNHEQLKNRFLQLPDQHTADVIPSEAKPLVALEKKTYHIYFEPKPEFFNDGSNPLFLLAEIAALGKNKTIPHFRRALSEENVDPLQCYSYWDIFLETVRPQQEIRDVFVFVEASSIIEITEIPFTGLLVQQPFIDAVSAGIYGDERLDLPAVLALAASAGVPAGTKQEAALSAQQASEAGGRKADSKEKTISSIRVSSDKLDELMNLVSELVTAQAGLSLYSENHKIMELETITENVVKLSRRLRDVAFGMTLVPINNMFGRFQRMVRDISSQLGKEVEFVTEGGETELDKTIIETLTDPLMHILRNSLDHGIEKADERVRFGKPRQGRVLLKAYYSGVFVYIQVTDDGKGIDPERVRATALEKGIIRADDVLTEEEIFNLIFYPGFSTAKEITDVSGRGVGMDVVKRNITDLKGTIHVASRLHEGTTLTIRLPLTLSIIDGLLVDIDGTKYLIPLSIVVKCYEVENKEMSGNFNRLLLLDEEQVPFVNLREEFGYTDVPEGTSQVIVVSDGEGRVGISVDFIVGEYQAVIKPLGKYYKHQDFVSGATILGDGTIALVLDVRKIVELCAKNAGKIWQQV